MGLVETDVDDVFVVLVCIFGKTSPHCVSWTPRMRGVEGGGGGGGKGVLLLLLSALVYLREDFPLRHFTGSLGLRGTGGVGIAVEMGRGCWW